MALDYSGTAIPNGDQSPTAAKGTDFGLVLPGLGHADQRRAHRQRQDSVRLRAR